MAAPRAELKPEDHYHHAPDRTELEKVLQQGGSKLKPYTTQIVVGLLLVLAVGLGSLLWSMQAKASRSVGWSEFLKSKGPEELESVADKNPGTSAGMWSRLHAGRVYLQEGLNAALTDRKLSDERLNKAKESFNKLLAAGAGTAPHVREEALYGLATVLEALSNGDNTPAIEAYETLIKDYPDSTHTPWSKARVEELKKPDSKTFYAWFRQQNPQPGDRPAPFDLPTVPPPDDIKIPDIKIDLDKVDLNHPLLPQNSDNPGAPGAGPVLPPMNGPAAPDMPAQIPPGQNGPAMNAPVENPPAGNAPSGGAPNAEVPPAANPQNVPPQP